jgi:hypothetical protein
MGKNLPCSSEANMGDGDTAKDEERGETGEGKKPIEDVSTGWRQVDECQTSEEELEKCDHKRTTLLVNVCEELGTHTMLGKSLEGTGGSKCARVGDAHHRDQDHGVEDGWENLDAGKLNGNDEWRVTTGRPFTVVERAIGWDNESNKEQVNNVEDADTPHNLLGGLGNLLSWVFSLGGGETSQFGTTKSERSSDEDRAESVEAVKESGVWCVPRLVSFLFG